MESYTIFYAHPGEAARVIGMDLPQETVDGMLLMYNNVKDNIIFEVIEGRLTSRFVPESIFRVFNGDDEITVDEASGRHILTTMVEFNQKLASTRETWINFVRSEIPQPQRRRRINVERAIYTVAFVHPHITEAKILSFDTPDFLRGAITVLNWLNRNHRDYITQIHHGHLELVF